MRPPVAIGRYSVAFASEPLQNGGYRARVTVSSGRGQGSHHRITRLHRPFASPQAAQLVALTHGWLQTLGSQPSAC